MLGSMMLVGANALLPHTARPLRSPQLSRSVCHVAGVGMGSKRDIFKYTGKLRPGQQSARRKVPKTSMLPNYALNGVPKADAPRWQQIEVKSPKDIAGMRAAGRVAREVLDTAGVLAVPGTQTDAIDACVHDETIKRCAYPSPLNYHGFPKSCCTSVNEVTRPTVCYLPYTPEIAPSPRSPHQPERVHPPPSRAR